ncbi:sulfite exporter TauE/SafE [Bradyrhizobium sp. USDA 4501]
MLYLFRLLIALVGAVVGLIGFACVTFAWMRGVRADFMSWMMLVVGAIAWFQGKIMTHEEDKKDFAEGVIREFKKLKREQ